MNATGWSELVAALAEDAASLAALHDRELTPALVAALKEVGFPANLGLLPATPAAQDAWALMDAAVAALPAAPDASEMDDLAAEYAAVYLTGAYGASPCESVWLDDDHLICQGPMFALRERYAAKGLAAENWRLRPDDHLVVQLSYIAHALRSGQTDDDWRALAEMLDMHLLRWLPDFAGRVAGRAALAFYAGLAAVTATWCDALRDILATRLDEPRPTPEEIAARGTRPREPEPVPVAFVPGTGPGW